ncbi:MAG: UDP-N-acetylglucosamine 1-carboxyvinyltransferase [Candidatus Pacebacteria bacterium]|nr:UDP-N-acetylglucosamine 1-carboxyvinyltransferase [Candidatus Paceibacterota bacterium]
MEEKFLIKGGKKLKGEIEISGCKNAATPILAATLLTEEDCIIDNLPLIEDIFSMIEILQNLGAKIEWQNKKRIKVNTKNINLKNINKKTIQKLRSSILILGPLLARFGKIELPQPGGCIIGSRPIDAHIRGLEEIGVKSQQNKDYYSFQIKEIKNNKITLPEFSVTATENILLFSSILKQTTTLKIAAIEPHVQDLALVLNKMGAQINLLPDHTFQIKGKEKLSGFYHSIISDPVEAGTYLILAGATGGEIKVKKINPEHLAIVIEKLQEFGIKIIEKKNEIIAIGPKKLKSVSKIQTLPYPGLPTDLQCAFGALATQSPGATLIHDPMYEGRLKYLEEINRMGGNIIFCDPHRAIITGPTHLFGRDIKNYDLRGGTALIIAALIAQGESTIDNIYQIDRGYEKIETKLRKIGANIKRIKI